MRKDEQDPNWTNRKRWSPRNLGTYGFGSDSNAPEDVRASEREEPLERWHNREFYGQSEGYTTMLEADLPESRLRLARHHVSPSSHARWERSLHDDTPRHGWSRAFEARVIEQQRSGPHIGVGPKNYQRSDERIFEEVCERLMNEGQIDASGIEVRVSKGEVFLTGSVPDRRTKRLAEDVLEQIAGMHDVQNDLKIT